MNWPYPGIFWGLLSHGVIFTFKQGVPQVRWTHHGHLDPVLLNNDDTKSNMVRVIVLLCHNVSKLNANKQVNPRCNSIQAKITIHTSLDEAVI